MLRSIQIACFYTTRSCKSGGGGGLRTANACSCSAGALTSSPAQGSTLHTAKPAHAWDIRLRKHQHASGVGIAAAPRALHDTQCSAVADLDGQRFCPGIIYYEQPSLMIQQHVIQGVLIGNLLRRPSWRLGGGSAAWHTEKRSIQRPAQRILTGCLPSGIATIRF